MEKRTKKLDNRSRSKKRRNLTGGCREGTRQNLSMDRGTESMKGRGKRNRTKIGPNGNIPRDKKS